MVKPIWPIFKKEQAAKAFQPLKIPLLEGGCQLGALFREQMHKILPEGVDICDFHHKWLALKWLKRPLCVNKFTLNRVEVLF
jgi:hypothetical protein